jgi:hypothetical protein
MCMSSESWISGDTFTDKIYASCKQHRTSSKKACAKQLAIWRVLEMIVKLWFRTFRLLLDASLCHILLRQPLRLLQEAEMVPPGGFPPLQFAFAPFPRSAYSCALPAMCCKMQCSCSNMRMHHMNAASMCGFWSFIKVPILPEIVSSSAEW